MSYNAPADRTIRINGNVTIAGMTVQFVQGMSITMDASNFQRNSTGIGDSEFTQNGDVVGAFSFRLINTTDLYSGDNPPTQEQTISYWMQHIAGIDPVDIEFTETYNAPGGAGNNNARISFTGRIMKPGIIMDVGDALQDVVVDGEITEFTSAVRVSSPTIPTAISTLDASVISSSELDLSWTHPNNGGSPIEKYILSRFDDVIAEIPAGTTAYSDTGLTADTPYSYTIISVNEIGNSSPSNTALGRTDS